MSSPIQQAISLHQQGRISQAEALYLQILHTEPRSFDALHLLGVIRLGQGALDAAHDLISRALQIQTGHPSAHFNFGNLLRRMGQPEAALAAYEQALRLRPGFVAALSGSGSALQDLKRPAEALERFQHALALAPDDAEHLYNCGNALQQLKQNELSFAHYQLALRRNPRHAQAWANQGAVLRKLNRPHEALQSYQAALDLQPQGAEILWTNLGNLLLEMKRPEAALDSYQQALLLRPEHAETLALRAAALLALARPQEALDSCVRALRLDAGQADALFNHGNALHALGQSELALASYARLLERVGPRPQGMPDRADVLFNQGNVLLALQRAEEASASYSEALGCRPAFLEALLNRGAASLELGLTARALEDYLLAQQCRPDSADAHWGESLSRLLLGDVARGWEKYEWRWKTDLLGRHQRRYPQALWLGGLGGGDLRGKTILLHAEQGLGDTLQFCRYAKLARQRGARVVLQVQAPLKTLLGELEGPHLVLAQNEPLPEFDTHCPLMSLPLAFKTDLASIPAAAAYITCRPEWAQPWQARLGPKTRPRVGLVWSGSTTHTGDGKRSLPLARLAPLCRLLCAQLEFISLQKDLRFQDLAVLQEYPEIKHFGSQLSDFTDTAGLLAQMDVVLSVDTSVAHLAGAMGKPVWVLLAAGPDWRWLEGRADSPWYPSATLFRQERAGAWDGVLSQIERALKTGCWQVEKEKYWEYVEKSP